MHHNFEGFLKPKIADLIMLLNETKDSHFNPSPNRDAILSSIMIYSNTINDNIVETFNIVNQVYLENIVLFKKELQNYQDVVFFDNTKTNNDSISIRADMIAIKRLINKKIINNLATENNKYNYLKSPLELKDNNYNLISNSKNKLNNFASYLTPSIIVFSGISIVTIIGWYLYKYYNVKQENNIANNKFKQQSFNDIKPFSSKRLIVTNKTKSNRVKSLV